MMVPVLQNADNAMVSVLIPCFNAEAFVGAALDSVLAQTYSPIEISVVDDGSTDGSLAVLERFRERGVEIITQANAGQCAAANRALAASRGAYVKFFDADDLLHPELIALQMRALAGRTNAVALGEWARFHHAPDEAVFKPLAMYRNARPVDWLTDEFQTGELMMQCATFLIPRSILDRTGGWDERLSLINDFEFFARVLIAADEIVYAHGARMFYRSAVSGSLSRQKSRRAADSAYLALLQGAGHLLDYEDSERTRLACATILQTFEFEFYPAYANLRRKMREQIAVLGGGTGQPPGPPSFHMLRRFIGWRAARRVQHLAVRLGLNHAARSRSR